MKMIGLDGKLSQGFLGFEVQKRTNYSNDDFIDSISIFSNISNIFLFFSLYLDISITIIYRILFPRSGIGETPSFGWTQRTKSLMEEQ